MVELEHYQIQEQHQFDWNPSRYPGKMAEIIPWLVEKHEPGDDGYHFLVQYNGVGKADSIVLSLEPNIQIIFEFDTLEQLGDLIFLTIKNECYEHTYSIPDDLTYSKAKNLVEKIIGNWNALAHLIEDSLE